MSFPKWLFLPSFYFCTFVTSSFISFWLAQEIVFLSVDLVAKAAVHIELHKNGTRITVLRWLVNLRLPLSFRSAALFYIKINLHLRVIAMGIVCNKNFHDYTLFFIDENKFIPPIYGILQKSLIKHGFKISAVLNLYSVFPTKVDYLVCLQKKSRACAPEMLIITAISSDTNFTFWSEYFCGFWIFYV
jgi:hypothetical protein